VKLKGYYKRVSRQRSAISDTRCNQASLFKATDSFPKQTTLLRFCFFVVVDICIIRHIHVHAINTFVILITKNIKIDGRSAKLDPI